VVAGDDAAPNPLEDPMSKLIDTQLIICPAGIRQRDDRELTLPANLKGERPKRLSLS